MTRVLFVSGAQGADYQCDMVLHGLRTLLGADCVDARKLPCLYEGSPAIGLWSIYGNLPDIPIDREDIPAKIASRYFDAIIYGSVHRNRDYLDAVRAAYPPTRIAFIDGEDDHCTAPLNGAGVYFKREIPADPAYDWILPIEFAIPASKIRMDAQHKTIVMAPCDPRDRATYAYYASESAYYDQYSSALFGYTMRKGGWDCARHYEIMAAGALPYFANLEACPARTMWRLPKLDLVRARELCDRWMGAASAAEWTDLHERVHATLVRDLTTEAMARYVLEHLT
jgi:hypothetical protein